LNSGEWWAVGGGPTSNFGYILHLTSMTSTSFTGVSFTVTCPIANCVLRSVYGTGSNNVWAVGDGGAFYLWNGVVWAGPVGVVGPIGPTTNLRSITFVGGDPNNGWAVGYSNPGGPEIYYWNGVSWYRNPPLYPGTIPSNVRLNDVQFWDSSHGWIAGDHGYILFYDGTNWTPVYGPSTYNITSIQAVSSSEAFAVGQDTASGQPFLLQWDGSVWSVITTHNIPFTNQGKLLSMYLDSPSDGFAVGTTVGGVVSLGMMFHLDPPGGGPLATTTTSTSSVVTTSTSIVSSTTSSTTSSITISSSSTSTSTSPVSTSSSQTSATSQLASSSSSSTASPVSTVTVTASSASSQTTPLVAPAIPGFPWESIAAGIVVGLAVLIVLRRRRSESG